MHFSFKNQGFFSDESIGTTAESLKLDSEAGNVHIDSHTGVHISASNSGTV